MKPRASALKRQKDKLTIEFKTVFGNTIIKTYIIPYIFPYP